jgi:hypothetical protein
LFQKPIKCVLAVGYADWNKSRQLQAQIKSAWNIAIEGKAMQAALDFTRKRMGVSEFDGVGGSLANMRNYQMTFDATFGQKISQLTITGRSRFAKYVGIVVLIKDSSPAMGIIQFHPLHQFLE